MDITFDALKKTLKSSPVPALEFNYSVIGVYLKGLIDRNPKRRKLIGCNITKKGDRCYTLIRFQNCIISKNSNP